MAFECMGSTDTGLWGGKVFWEKSFFLQGRNWGKRVIARVMFLLLLLAALCTLANANDIRVPNNIFEQPSYLFCCC